MGKIKFKVENMSVTVAVNTKRCLLRETCLAKWRKRNGIILMRATCKGLAGLPALQGSESGQVRKEAATADYCKCRGKARLPLWSYLERFMKKFAWFFCALILSSNVYAVDGVSIESGNGDATDMARVGAIWNWDKQWFNEGDWLVAGFWEASIGTWRGNSSVGNNQTIIDLGITPVFRLQQKNPSGFSPYAEGAIGFHMISPTFVYANRKFGSAFQFGDHVGLGVRFGVHQEFDLGYRFQHLSNGGIKKPNQGINFNQVRFAYYF